MIFRFYDKQGRERRLNEVEGTVTVAILPHATTHQPGGADAIPTGVVLPIIDGPATEGTAVTFARSDHRHPHGVLPGATLHAEATVSAAGFMSVQNVLDLADLKGNRFVYRQVRNETGATLLKGTLVYSVGFSSGVITVGVADKRDPSKRPAIAVLRSDLPNNTTANDALAAGDLLGVDTSALSLTDQLVLGNTGNFIRPPPDTFPFDGEIQLVGSVSRVSALDGVIAVNLEGLIPIAELEPTELVPNPEATMTGQSTRSAATSYEGASFVIRRQTIANRLAFAASSVPTSGDAAFAIYQAGGAGSGVATKIASIATAAIAATGKYVVAFDEGTVTFNPGIYYLLWGKKTGNFSLTCYATTVLDLLNGSLVDNATHPTTFTTALATTSIPATFDPLPTGGGGQATASTGNTALQHRLLKV